MDELLRLTSPPPLRGRWAQRKAAASLCEDKEDREDARLVFIYWEARPQHRISAEDVKAWQSQTSCNIMHHASKHGKKHFIKKPKDIVDIVAEDENASILKDKSAELDAERVLKDPCSKVRCGPGRECVIHEDLTATCECVTKCQPETDPRRKVCSNHNQTWDSDCELYQMRCLCEDEKEGCKGEKYEHIHVDYYGACRELPKCVEEEMEDFPRRMREWLFNVMQDLAKRHELNEPYKKLEEEAESLQSRQWVNAVIWKFCELDSHPHDRAVSRHELFPLRAPLLSMEHCIAPFLNGCDKNDDHTITLKEWGECLGLEDGEIQDRCAQITA